MEITKTFYAKNRKEWRQWLRKNYKTEKDIWLIYYNKESGKPRVAYNDAVEEALCFGWIDGIRKSIDEESYKIRFTPRRKGSIWSAVNTKRIKELIKPGLVKPSGLEAFSKRDEKKTNRYSFEQEKVKLPAEFEKKIKANKKAWEYFQKLPAYAKRVSTWWVISAKKDETKLSRLNTLIKCSEEGRKIPGLVISKKDK